MGQGPLVVVLRRYPLTGVTSTLRVRPTHPQTSGSEPSPGLHCTSASRQNCTTSPSSVLAPGWGQRPPLVTIGGGWVGDPGLGAILCLFCLSARWPCGVNAIFSPLCTDEDAKKHKSLGDFCEMMRWNYELQVSH